jgi:hypothetical protein
MDFAVVAPNGKSAIFRQEGQPSLLRGLDTGFPSPLPFNQALSGVDRVAWAPDSSNALLYASTTRQLQRVNVVPAQPQLDSPIEFPAVTGAVAALAVSPSGQIVLAFRGSSAGLYLVSADGSLMLLTAMDEPGAIAFTHDGRSLFALDAKSMRILEVDNVSGSPTVVPFADLSDSSSQFNALAVSANGQYLYVAVAGPDCVRVFATASRTQTAAFPLDAPPTRLQTLSDSLYLLNDDFTAGMPLQLFQASPRAGTWFVPAPQED